jgi:hypothetical protein
VNSILSTLDLDTNLNGILPRADVLYVWLGTSFEKIQQRRNSPFSRKKKRREEDKKRGDEEKRVAGSKPGATEDRYYRPDSTKPPRRPRALSKTGTIGHPRPVLPPGDGRYHRPWYRSPDQA